MVKYNLIPKPNSYVMGDSTYVVSSKSKVLCSEEFVSVGKVITEYLKTKPEENEGLIKIKKVNGLSSEEYALKITNDGVFIEASDFAGAFYGAVTFRTILMQAEKHDGKAKLETLIIKDKPESSYRGLMLDSSRHFFEVEIVKELLDNMAMLKLNKFHWHLSDDQGFRIESKIYPSLNEIGSKRESRHLKGCGMDFDHEEYFHYYTHDEIKDVVAYAARRNIEIIPEIDIPGHTFDILASLPELGCNGEAAEVLSVNGVSKSILCAGNEKTFEFLDNLLGEVCPLFPSNYFHIGGDEAFRGYKIWEECDKCKSLMSKLGITKSKDLQIWFMNKVADILKKYGKQPIAWDDCMGDSLDSDIICQFWRPNAVGEVKRQSYKREVIVSPTSHFYFDNKFAHMPLKRTYGFNKYKVGFTSDKQKYFGLECEVWTEWIDGKDVLEFSVFPRLNAFSEVAWTNFENRNYKDFHRRLDWYKTYMRKKNINYSRVEKVRWDFQKTNPYHLGADGKEYKKSMELKRLEK